MTISKRPVRKCAENIVLRLDSCIASDTGQITPGSEASVCGNSGIYGAGQLTGQNMKGELLIPETVSVYIRCWLSWVNRCMDKKTLTYSRPSLRRLGLSPVEGSCSTGSSASAASKQTGAGVCSPGTSPDGANRGYCGPGTTPWAGKENFCVHGDATAVSCTAGETALTKSTGCSAFGAGDTGLGGTLGACGAGVGVGTGCGTGNNAT
jgi:hypothetical protein